MHKGEILFGVTPIVAEEYIKQLEHLEALMRIIDNPTPGLGVSDANKTNLQIVMYKLSQLERKYPKLDQIRLNP